ncbi:MAG: hypothetical protein AB7U83_04760 [Vicinamibacterales bacterium]
MSTTRNRGLAEGAVAVPAGLFALAAGFALAKTGRDAGFLSGGGLSALPAMYVTVALLSVPFGFGTIGLMRGVGGRRAHAWMSAVTAVALWDLAMRPLVGTGLRSLAAYVAVPLAFGVLFSLTWLVVPSSVLTRDGQRHPRAFLLAGAAALAGGVCGGVVAALLAPVGWNGLVFAAAGVLVAIGARLVARAPCVIAPAAVATPTKAPAAARPSGPRVLLLVSAAALTAMVGVFVEYRFYAAVVEASPAGDTIARLAALHIGVNAVALVGLLVTPWLQRHAGIGGALSVLPAAVAAGATGVWLGGPWTSPALLRATEGGLKASVHRVSWEQVQLWLPSTSRPRVKMVLDGMTTRMAEGAAGLLLWGLLSAGVTPRAVTGVLVVLAATWLAVVARVWAATAHLPAGEAHDQGRLPDS